MDAHSCNTPATRQADGHVNTYILITPLLHI